MRVSEFSVAPLGGRWGLFRSRPARAGRGGGGAGRPIGPMENGNMPLQKCQQVGKGRKKRGQGLTGREGAKTNCKCMLLRPSRAISHAVRVQHDRYDLPACRISPRMHPPLQSSRRPRGPKPVGKTLSRATHLARDDTSGCGTVMQSAACVVGLQSVHSSPRRVCPCSPCLMTCATALERPSSI